MNSLNGVWSSSKLPPQLRQNCLDHSPHSQSSDSSVNLQQRLTSGLLCYAVSGYVITLVKEISGADEFEILGFFIDFWCMLVHFWALATGTN